MNPQLITAVLLPTSEASELSIENNSLRFYEGIKIQKPKGNEEDINPQFLYLCIEGEIKEGDWFYHKNYKTPFIDKCIKINGDIAMGSRLHWSISGSNTEYKILSTNDPKLIADGVSKLPENATIDFPSPKELPSWNHKTVNFLSEFCKIWNEKNKKLPVINFKDATLEDLYKRGFPKPISPNGENDVDVEKEDFFQIIDELLRERTTLKETINSLFSLSQKMASQALQSQTRYSELEKWVDFQLSLFPTGDYKGAMLDIKSKIQSITPKQEKPKEMEMYIEIDESFENLKIGDNMPNKPKLNKDGSPVIHFK